MLPFYKWDTYRNSPQNLIVNSINLMILRDLQLQIHLQENRKSDTWRLTKIWLDIRCMSLCILVNYINYGRMRNARRGMDGTSSRSKM